MENIDLNRVSLTVNPTDSSHPSTTQPCNQRHGSSEDVETSDPNYALGAPSVWWNSRHVFGDLYAASYIFLAYLVTLESILVSLLSAGTTYFYCTVKLGDNKFAGNISWVFISFAVVFPLTYGIGEAFKRREQALRHFAGLKANLCSVYMAHADWSWGTDPTKGRQTLPPGHVGEVSALMLTALKEMQQILSLPSIRVRHTTASHRFETNVKTQRQCAVRIMESFGGLSHKVEDMKLRGLPGPEASRIRQFAMIALDHWENLNNIKMYRTPQSTRSFARMFIWIHPFFFGPYYAYVAGNLSPRGSSRTDEYFAMALSVLTTMAMVGLFNIRFALEDPFNEVEGLVDAIHVRDKFEDLRRSLGALSPRQDTSGGPSSGPSTASDVPEERQEGGGALAGALPDLPPAQEESAGPAEAPTGAYRMATQLVHPAQVVDDPYMATNVPIYQTATFGQPSATTFGQYDYTRSGNPTRHALEQQMAALEGAAGAYAFASGMAALAAVCGLVQAGQRIVAGTDVYGGTARLLAQVAPGRGVAVTSADTGSLAAMRAAITADTAVVLLESPTNPRMQVVDVRAIADVAHAAGALVVVDNSMMAPCFQRALGLGADIAMTSATKFICGHSDVTGGVLACRTRQLADRVYFLQNAEGAALGPFDCWLCLRGLKTMSLRMEKQAQNAAELARWLAAHPLVRRVNYPGLPSHPGHDLHKQQASSPGSLLSFTTGDVEVSRRVVEETKLFKITVSFGNVASLISLPCFMSHASIPADVRAARGLPDDLVRISAGIEDVRDLIADLQQAMPTTAGATGAAPPERPG